MPLENAMDLARHAVRGGYALGYFESWNLESLQGTIDAAEAARAPVVLGFNGEFLSREGRITPEDISWYGALGIAAAKAARVPCAFIFNECASDAAIRRAVHCGFNLVMPSNTDMAAKEYRNWVADVTQYAHAENVAVEAEIGELPCGAHSGPAVGGTVTQARDAAEFVEATGVDLLAVSVGNVHIKIEGQQDLDLRQLAEIQRQVSVPLVLHGGTGIEAGSLREAIKLGIAKVNYGTYLKQHYLKAIREALQSNESDPHKLLGMGEEKDVLVAGRLAVRDAVLERIELLGCCGRA